MAETNTVTTNELLADIRKAIECGKILRNTFGGNVGGGEDIFKKGIQALNKLEAQLVPF